MSKKIKAITYSRVVSFDEPKLLELNESNFFENEKEARAKIGELKGERLILKGDKDNVLDLYFIKKKSDGEITVSEGALFINKVIFSDGSEEELIASE